MDGTPFNAASALTEPGRKIYYRNYLIHGEVPDYGRNVCYTVYARQADGLLKEVGVAAGFRSAMRWVDRHIADLTGVATRRRLRRPAVC